MPTNIPSLLPFVVASHLWAQSHLVPPPYTMPDWVIPVIVAVIAGAATVAAASIPVIYSIQQYKKRVEAKLRSDAHQALMTEERLQADFRSEIHKEMERLRDRDEHREKAYRALEEENSSLRKQITNLEIKIIKLEARLGVDGSADGVTTTTVTRKTTQTQEA